MDTLDQAGPGLFLTPDQIEQMRTQVSSQSHEEACGFLAGTAGRVLQVIAVENELHSPVRYRMEPVQQLKAFQFIDEQGWELLGIYHSHPHGPDHPSMTDLREAYYPDVVYLIWSRSIGGWSYRAYKLHEHQFHETRVHISSGQ